MEGSIAHSMAWLEGRGAGGEAEHSGHSFAAPALHVPLALLVAHWRLICKNVTQNCFSFKTKDVNVGVVFSKLKPQYSG